MAVTSIEMVDETNTYPTDGYYDEPPQGVTYQLKRIYKVTNTDGPDQYFSFTVELDSYGNAGGNYSSAEQCIPRKFVPVVPHEETRTVWK